MSIAPAASSYIEFTPQVMAAKAASLRQEIGIAVVNKSRAAQDVQAGAVLQMLQNVSAGIEGVGQNINVRV